MFILFFLKSCAVRAISLAKNIAINAQIALCRRFVYHSYTITLKAQN